MHAVTVNPSPSALDDGRSEQNPARLGRLPFPYLFRHSGSSCRDLQHAAAGGYEARKLQL